MIASILVPVDGSAHAMAAVDWASDLAVKYGARLILLHVVAKFAPELYADEMRALAKTEDVLVTGADLVQSLSRPIVEPAAQRARSHGATMVETAVETGDPAAIILDWARAREVDLIVMGRRGLGSLPGLVLGSVSTKVLHLSDCACLTVK